MGGSNLVIDVWEKKRFGRKERGERQEQVSVSDVFVDLLMIIFEIS